MKKIILFTILTISAFTDVLCQKKSEPKASTAVGAITIVNNNPSPIAVVLIFRQETNVSPVSSVKVKVGANSSQTVKIGAKPIRKVSVQNGSSLDIVKAHRSYMKSGKITVQGSNIVLGEDALFSIK